MTVAMQRWSKPFLAVGHLVGRAGIRESGIRSGAGFVKSIDATMLDADVLEP